MGSPQTLRLKVSTCALQPIVDVSITKVMIGREDNASAQVVLALSPDQRQQNLIWEVN